MSYYISFIDPGNAGGSVPIPDTSCRTPNKPIRYACRYCKSSFTSDEKRVRHECEEHPMRNPLLIINGKEISASRMKIRDICFFNDIQILHADQVIINDKIEELDSINNKLSEFKRKFFKVELKNQQITRKFEIDVDIIDNKDIKSIDSLFLEMLSEGDFKEDLLVDKFIDMCEDRCPNATTYTDALVKYLQGIKAKDGYTERISFEEHVTKLNQALDTLKWFNSDLSNSIVGIIEFNFNRFVPYSGRLLSPNLKCSILFFIGNEICHISEGQEEPSIPIPVDRVTSLIINSILNMYRKHSFSDIERLVKPFKNSGITQQDRAKLNFILYKKAIDEGLKDRIYKLEKQLKHDEVFQHMLVEEN